jgi:hypothetical protein
MGTAEVREHGNPSVGGFRLHVTVVCPKTNALVAGCVGSNSSGESRSLDAL